MSVIIIIGVVIIFYVVGYRYYAKTLDRRIIEPDDGHTTAAHLMGDNVDYYPFKKSILFGHHFASIAGAGPIIGTIVAIGYFGWVATLGWIMIGSIFFGAVHDYLALMISVRNRGSSIPDIANKAIGSRAKAVFSVFLWVARWCLLLPFSG